jgi:hypothetical protein
MTSTISARLPTVAEAPQSSQTQAPSNGNNCCTTAMKIAFYSIAAFAAIASFLFLGPIIGVATLLTVGALACFASCCCGNSNRSSWGSTGRSYVPIPVTTAPVTPIPRGPAWGPFPGWSPRSHAHAPATAHVPVGRGTVLPTHIPVAAVPQRPVGRHQAGPTAIPVRGQVGHRHGDGATRAAGHVPVGHRHGDGATRAAGVAARAAGHVPVGHRGRG